MSGLPAPNYASNKYRNTIELLGKASGLHEAVRDGRVDLGPLEGRRFKQSFDSLSLKEQVLGYLEDLTAGAMHRDPINKDELRVYIDWILSDKPEVQFPFNKYPRAFSRVQWLRGYVNGSQDPDRAKREILRTIYMESRPELPLDGVENLVLAGGGAKALSLAGALDAIDERGYRDQIKRVAGTSGGAIMAMGFAAGYDSKELQDLVRDNEFGLFTLGSRFDNGLMNQWAHHFNQEPGSGALHVLSDNALAHRYHNHLMDSLADAIRQDPDPRLGSLKKTLDKKAKGKGERPLLGKALAARLEKLPNKEAYYHAILDVLGQDTMASIDGKAMEKTNEQMGDPTLTGGISLYRSPRQALVNAMRHRTGQDLIRGFFSDLIYDKLKNLPNDVLRSALYGERYRDDPTKAVSQADLRNINFSQWQRLHELVPDQVKELHISMSILKPAKARLKTYAKGKYDPYEHQDAAHDNPDFAGLPVADAVRISMNLPPVYPRYEFTLNGKTYKGSDGGLKSNMSLATFDDKHPPEKTIGVFYKTSGELQAAVDVNRMLVIPRSTHEVSRELTLAQAKDQALRQEWLGVKQTYDQFPQPINVNDGKVKSVKNKMDLLMDERRTVGRMVASLGRELDTIKGAQTGTLDRWISRPMGEMGHLLSRYLDSKSQDQLGQEHNLRRLVMINTADVGTMDFKLTSLEKEMQLKYGRQAMGSLLNGTYCLENHFYYHHLRSLTETLLDHNMQRLVSDTPLPMDPLPVEHLPPDEHREILERDFERTGRQFK